MSYDIKFLSNDLTHDLYMTFMEAFSDYVTDASKTEEQRLLNRFAKNGVDYEMSVGAFYEGKMVGFTVVALDEYCGAFSAYDSATGIIKPHRGKGLAKKMFEFALPALKARGVKRFYLEAIQINEPAVKAYLKTGFTITRELDSFDIKFDELVEDGAEEAGVDVYPINKSELGPAAEFFDWPPSWEKSLSCLQRIPDEVLCLGAFDDGKMVGVLVHYPAANWIMSLGVDKAYRKQGIGTALLTHMKESLSDRFEATKIINVDHSDDNMIGFLKNRGFTFELNQYEMKLDL